MTLRSFSQNFRDPLLVLLGISLYGLFSFLHIPLLALFFVAGAIVMGSYTLFLETWINLFKKQFALDYIAILAVVVSTLTGEYLVASIIALMISSGSTLEKYGAQQAKKSLTGLAERIPQRVLLWENNAPGKIIPISKAKKGQDIFIRKGEVIPLDGLLVTDQASVDESSLTGEPYPVEKVKGDLVQSGTINVGQTMVLTISREEKDSTYRKIITMVQDAQTEKAPLIRLADRYSTFFTLVTLAIAAFAFFHLGTLKGALAVLVIATPCPLIIATPIALLGGINAAAKRRIIIKRLAVLESLDRVDTLVFDKTGTITLGQPLLQEIIMFDKKHTKDDILAIAASIERSSLHPLAKTIVQAAQEKNLPVHHVSHIHEELGKGISGEIDKTWYCIKKAKSQAQDMKIEIATRKKIVASFTFKDALKSDSKTIVQKLQNAGYGLYIFTGDKKVVADEIASQLNNAVKVQAEMSPQDKQQGVAELKKQRKTVAMIGDGINDAPALALSDVGIVFSNDEQTAASEAADVVLLGGDLSLTSQVFDISKRSIKIAKQSILWGIGISIVGMVLASFGLIPPLLGAGIQEAIDIAVILNALRASRI